jgi:SAM-dependent methyltransferase
MNEIDVVVCPVCTSCASTFYIDTNALMHKTNNERFVFNKCKSCDTVFLTNPIKEVDLENYYTDNYLPYQGFNAWGRYKIFVKKSQENLDLKRARLVAKYTTNKKSFSILDVGCGNPSFLATVQKKFGAHCTGVDFSDNGWKDQRFPNLTLVKSTLADFVPEQKFDVITLWHYLEHDYNLQETVDKLYSCLNPNGKIIIEVPDYDSITAKRQKQFWQGWHSPRHLTLFSTKGLRTLFSADKWSIVKHNRFGTLEAFRLWWLGNMEKNNTDWSGSMQGEFWPLVFLKAITFPFFIFERFVPMGIQLIIFEKK